MIETSMVLYADKYMVSMTKGKPGSVEFDFEAVWRFRSQVLEFDAKKLTWLHCHPLGFGVAPSEQDRLCALSLRMAFKSLGKFGILHFNSPSVSECYGQVGWYVFNEQDELVLSHLQAIDDDPYLKGPAMVLKLHAFKSNQLDS